MKKLIHMVLPASVIFIALFMTNAMATQCTKALIKAMKDEGLSEGQIKSICTKAESYAEKKSNVFTPEKIEQDLMGRSVGPESTVKVKTKPGNRHGTIGAGSSSASDRTPSYDAYVTVPMGIRFDGTNIQDIKVLDTTIKSNQAQVVAHVDTVSGYSGRLRLYYELIAGQWTLMQIENLDFRQQ
jgi:hypothetical protein